MKALLVIIVLLALGGVAYYAMEPAGEYETSTETSTSDYGATSESENMNQVETDEETTTPAEEETAAEAEAVTETEAETEITTPVAEVETEVQTEPVATTRVFDISGTNFAFDVTEMRVKEGDTVTVNFTSASGFHDWVVDEFNAATDQVGAGTPTSVTFVADKAGTYEYYCSVGSHRANGMVGTLIVE